MSCDLHIHSTCSDGAVPIERLASIAARTGLHAIALSDHDTLLSAQYAYAHTGQDGVELIPAVELTGYDFERQHRVHLLCYYPDVDCPALREHCAIMKERRNACALQSAKELEQLYPQFTTDLAWETTKASGVLFKSGLMQALELLGLTDGSIYGETYHKLFGWNPRGIVLHSPEYLPVRQVLATAKASGGAGVFAHPTVYKSMPLLRELAEPMGIAVTALEPVTWKGETVSSSRIRRCLLEGDTELAGELLGTPYAVCGKAVRRGEELCLRLPPEAQGRGFRAPAWIFPIPIRRLPP